MDWEGEIWGLPELFFTTVLVFFSFLFLVLANLDRDRERFSELSAATAGSLKPTNLLFESLQRLNA